MAKAMFKRNEGKFPGRTGCIGIDRWNAASLFIRTNIYVAGKMDQAASESCCRFGIESPLVLSLYVETVEVAGLRSFTHMQLSSAI